MDEELARKQRERGYSDGKVGHSPSHLRGPYMEGYIQGRRGDELDHSFRIPPDPKDEEIKKLRAENKRFRTFIKDVVLNYDPRSDIYATELHGDAHETLGHCRCCGQEVCDDA